MYKILFLAIILLPSFAIGGSLNDFRKKHSQHQCSKDVIQIVPKSERFVIQKFVSLMGHLEETLSTEEFEKILLNSSKNYPDKDEFKKFISLMHRCGIMKTIMIDSSLF